MLPLTSLALDETNKGVFLASWSKKKDVLSLLVYRERCFTSLALDETK